MDESNRVPQRTRPRPYDLRRKVLLKNFLREQMTHIPLPPPRMPMEALEDDPVTEQEDPMSLVGNEENIEQPNNKKPSVSSSSATEPIPSTSAQSFSDEIPTESPQLEIEPEKSVQPTFSRLSSLLRLNISSVLSRRKRITKAKLKIKVRSPAQQSLFRTSIKSEDDHSSKGKKSFFAMFKTRRANKRKETPTPKAQTPNPVTETKSNTSNQSVQTEASFTQEEYNNMEQSNRCLREENRLLSESLSSFMSDYKFQLSPLKIPYGTDSYITSSGTSQVSNTSQQTTVDVTKHVNSQDKNDSKVKIPRSKSMQERLDKKTPYKPRLRTRSMNYGLSKRFYDSSSLGPRDSDEAPYGRSVPQDERLRLSPCQGKYKTNSFPAFKSFSRLGISRPASNANSRLLPHQGRSVPQDQGLRLSPRRGKYKTNSFPAFESFSRLGISRPASNANSRLLPHQAPVLKNLPVNNSSRAIVRRSSMPERTSYHPARPILRHKSTRIAGYNRGNSYDVEHTDHNYNVTNGNVPIRRRSNSGDYGRPVPLQNLPPEAFY